MRLTLALLLLAGCASAPKKIEKPFFYELRRGAQTGHMFGTMHGKIAPAEIPSYVVDTIDSSDALAVESSEKVDKEIWVDYFLWPHKHARELLTPVEYDGARKWLEFAYGEVKTKEILANDSPMILYARLATLRFRNDHREMAWDDSIRERTTMIDRAFESRAKQNRVDIIFLDDREASERALNCARKTDEQYAEAIRSVLTGKDLAADFVVQSEKLAEIYRSGDAEALRAFAASQPLENADTCLLKERNAAWVPEIDHMFDRYKSPFIAVGILHLEAAHDSLAEMLRTKGFTVKRVDPPAVR